MMALFKEENGGLIGKWRMCRSFLEELKEIKKKEMDNDMMDFVNEIDNYFQAYLQETRATRSRVITSIEEDVRKSVTNEKKEKNDQEQRKPGGEKKIVI